MKRVNAAAISMVALFVTAQAEAQYSDGFNYPLGPGGERQGAFDPETGEAARFIGNKQGYYIFFGFRDERCSVGRYENGRCTNPEAYIQYHLGDDWNGTADASGDQGHPVYAASNGRVLYSGRPSDGWNNVIIIETNAPPASRGFRLPEGGTVWRVHHLYGHLLERNVSEGTVVRKGQMIGRIGTSSVSTGPHLHFEIRTHLGGMSGGGYSRYGTAGFVAPAAFIEKNRMIFGDVPETAWYAPWVKVVTIHRVVSGMHDSGGEPTGAFNPSAAVTRAEFVKMALRGEGSGFDMPDAALACPQFSDVPMFHPLYRFVQYAKCVGIVSGQGGTNAFQPNAPVNRAEAAKILAETWGLTGGAYNPAAFSDVSGNAWYTPYVMRCYEHGIVGGYPDGTFRPAQNLNRAEAAKIVARALEEHTN